MANGMNSDRWTILGVGIVNAAAGAVLTFGTELPLATRIVLLAIVGATGYALAQLKSWDSVQVAPPPIPPR